MLDFNIIKLLYGKIVTWPWLMYKSKVSNHTLNQVTEAAMGIRVLRVGIEGGYM